jgi:hypothetical protein
MTSIEADFWAELVHIEVESIGWIPLDTTAYLHVGADEAVIQFVGVATPVWLLYLRTLFSWNSYKPFHMISNA